MAAAMVGGTAYVAGKAGAKAGASQAQEQAAYVQQQAAQAAAAPAEADYMAELEQLAQLKAQGILSEEEFEAKKKQILGI